MSTRSRQTFIAYGRSLQLEIRTAEDLAHAAELDAAHWAATSAPLALLGREQELLHVLDRDRNDRLTCHELKSAIRWLLDVLRDHRGIDTASECLDLDAVNPDHPDGAAALHAARRVLARLGREDDRELSLQEVARLKVAAEANPVSEAGVVLPSAAGDEPARQFLLDILSTVGGSPHPGGGRGVSAGDLSAMREQAKAWLDWLDRGRLPEVLPLGEQTPAAFDLVDPLRGKIDQYFAQCQALAADPRLSRRIGWSEADLDEIRFDDPEAIAEFLRTAPLSSPNPRGILDLQAPMNPHYAPAVERLAREVLPKILARDVQELGASDWQRVKDVFQPYQTWQAQRPQTAVTKLSVEKLREYLEGSQEAAVRGLIAESAATALALDNLRLLEKLIRLQARILTLANNFVSFPYLYDTANRALFEMGSLVMDGRRFNLAVRVLDRAVHANVAQTGSMFVMYVELLPPGNPPIEVAVPVTFGGKGNLCVGKQGVFHGVDGREWPARVVSLIENPIGYAEAIWAPFRRIGQLITGRIESLTRQAEEHLDARAGTAVEQIGPRTEEVAPPPPPRAQRGPTGGMMLGAGVAAAAVGSALAYISSIFAQDWRIPVIGVGIAVGIVLVPTSILAFLKLRRRDLSSLLEGSGWAVNARMRLDRRQAKFFSHRPAYPMGAHGTRALLLRRVLMIILLLGALVFGGLALRSCAAEAQTPSGQTPDGASALPQPTTHARATGTPDDKSLSGIGKAVDGPCRGA